MAGLRSPPPPGRPRGAGASARAPQGWPGAGVLRKQPGAALGPAELREPSADLGQGLGRPRLPQGPAEMALERFIYLCCTMLQKGRKDGNGLETALSEKLLVTLAASAGLGAEPGADPGRVDSEEHAHRVPATSPGPRADGTENHSLVPSSAHTAPAAPANSRSPERTRRRSPAGSGLL